MRVLSKHLLQQSNNRSTGRRLTFPDICHSSNPIPIPRRRRKPSQIHCQMPFKQRIYETKNNIHIKDCWHANRHCCRLQQNSQRVKHSVSKAKSAFQSCGRIDMLSCQCVAFSGKNFRQGPMRQTRIQEKRKCYQERRHMKTSAKKTQDS